MSWGIGLAKPSSFAAPAAAVGRAAAPGPATDVHLFFCAFVCLSVWLVISGSLSGSLSGSVPLLSLVTS